MTADLETLTQRFGRSLFARLKRSGPILLSPRWWDQRLMEWTMDEPAVKVQLFRLIDVLPMLHTPGQVTRHLREYFTEVEDALPALLRLGVRWLPSDRWAGRLVAGLATHNARRMARRFIAGTTVPEALTAVAVMRRQAMAFTIDLLGEAVLSDAEAEQYQRSYLELIDGLTREVNRWPEVELIDREPAQETPEVRRLTSGRHGDTTLPRVNVSLKLSSLYSQFDPIDPEGTSAAVKERLRPVLQLARARGAFVNIDMEQFAYKDLTLHIFQEVLLEPEFRDWPDVGVAIQAYLRSCGDDLKQLAGWAEKRGTPVWVRLVKGAYWDYETIHAAQQGWPAPVFTDKSETDANFEVQTRFLMERHELLRPAIGSHNARSIAHALAVAEQLGLPPRGYEFQMLDGMADPIKSALVRMGRRVRIYTPYGQLLPGMAYLVRRLLENTANQSFLRASFIEHVPEEQLLMNPSTAKSGVRSAESGVKNGSSADSRLQTPDSGRFQIEPLTDFSREPARQAMQEALRQVAAQLGRTYPLLIDGQEVQTSQVLESINPSHRRQVVGKCSLATADDAHRAVAAAVRAFPAWRATAVEERAQLLARAAAIMRRRRFELAAWQVYECGKQWREADADVAESIDYCDYYAREMLRLSKPQHRDVPGEDNQYFYEPRGVAVIIAPWNFPLAILCGMTAAALVTGNTAIMKPAEQSAVMGAQLMEVFREAGFPPGVVSYLPGRGEEIGPVLVNHREVALIAFTGSRAVGLAINRQAAETPAGQAHVKRVIAEMGGKNAIIVDDDADLDEAVHGVAASAFGYAGQKCSACSRVIVLESIHDAFLNRLVEATRSLKVGPAEDPGCFVGPVIDEEAQRRILAAIEKGKQEAKLVHASDVRALAEDGFYVGPHIFADVSPASGIAQEEIFGPVLAVLKARDLTHALELANGTAYALTGGLYSRSPANIARVRRDFRVGNLYINRKITGALVDRQPFGGFRLSGIGSKAGGPDYLLQFLLPRTITENTMRHGFAPVEAPKTSVSAERL